MNQTVKFRVSIRYLCLVLFILLIQVKPSLAQPILKQMANARENRFDGSNGIQLKPITLLLPAPLSKSNIPVSQSATTAQGGLVTIMTEDFEGAFPSGLWSLSTGNYAWAKRNVAAHKGSNSAWAIGGGTIGSTLNFNAYYPNSTTTVMTYGPFDLSDANWAAYTFYLWANLQENSDYFYFMASDDGQNFYGYALHGSTGGNWYPYSLPLHSVPTASGEIKNFTGKSTVWITFQFVSDASGNLPNGVFVDDIVLQKGMAQVPTIVTSFPTPGTSSRGLAWDGANLWCSDATNDRIYKLNSSGGVITSFASPGSTPTGMTWDGANLWNADATNDRIYKLSATGTTLTSFASPGGGPAGMAWDGANMWVSDYNVETIWKLTTSGSVISSFSAPGSYHYGLTYDGQNLWLVDADVLLMYKIDRSGNVLDFCLTPETWPSALAWDGNYFWMTDRSTNLIYKLQVQTQQLTNDVGVLSLDVPARLLPGDSTLIKVTIKNYGTASQGNFPVSYTINEGAPIIENFSGTISAGATATMIFSKAWKPATEGTYRFMAWTGLSGDENAANDGLATPKEVIVSHVNIVDVLIEDFEKYPTGVLADAPGSPWVRYSASRNGNVSTYWVHGGQKNFQINSFTTSTEIDYALLNLTSKPDQLNVELWYTPDGYYVYKDFATVGLGYSTSKYDLTQKAYFWGSDHDVLFQQPGMASAVNAFNELEYGAGPADFGIGTPKHNYIRAEFDFVANQVRFYIGLNSSAPLRSTINFNGNFQFNALYIAGGLNPTYIDDIHVTALIKSVTQPANDVGVTAMELPDKAAINVPVTIKAEVKNYGTAAQSNFPVTYRVNNGQPITETLTGSLAPGTSTVKTFSAQWTPTADGVYRFVSWTELTTDENHANDTLATPKDVIVSSQADSIIFKEDFESYPVGILADAPGSPWVRYSASRDGSVSTTWVHGGQKNFVLNSFTTSTEIDYVKLDVVQKPAQLIVELWYTPDGFFVYKDFAEAGLGYAASKYDMKMKAGFAGSDHNVLFRAEGMPQSVTVFNELEYGSLSGSPKHNYMRAEFDFTNNQVRFFIGSTPSAPLRSTVNFDGRLDVNALYFAGGLNPTYIDDIVVKAKGVYVLPTVNDIGIMSMGVPEEVELGDSVAISMVVKNFGNVQQSNFVLGYRIKNGPIITETFSDVLAAEASITYKFARQWVPDAEGVYQLIGWSALVGDHNTANDTFHVAHNVSVVKYEPEPPGWFKQNSTCQKRLSAVHFVDKNTGWAAGQDGTVLKTTNGGRTWKPITTQTFPAFTENIAFINQKTGLVLGFGSGYDVYRTTDAGASWTGIEFGVAWPKKAFFLNDQLGWIAGLTASYISVTTDMWGSISITTSNPHATIWKTTDGGATWTATILTSPKWLYSIYFCDAITGWTVGEDGVIFKSVDGGSTWTSQTSGTTNDLSSVYFVNTQIGYCVGQNGKIYKTVNGGSDWSDVSSNTGSVNWLSSVHFVNPQTGWAVGYNGWILKTTDGGASWLQQTSNTRDWLYSVYFVTDHIGWAVGSNGTILKTNNAGILTSVENNDDYQKQIPTKFSLSQNYPNPFNPSTVIEYGIPKASQVELKVFDLLGRELKVLVNDRQEAGFYQVTFDSQSLPAALYFYRLRAGEFCETKKMLIVK